MKIGITFGTLGRPAWEKDMIELSKSERLAAVLNGLPGLVHFGAQPLRLVPRDRCKHIRISVSESRLLNLSHVKIISANPLDKEIAEARLSSQHRSSAEPAGLLRHQPIHTNGDDIPYWKVEFKNPVDIAHLEIGNRLGRWGGRSYSLMVKFTHHDNREWVHDNLSPELISFKLKRYEVRSEQPLRH